METLDELVTRIRAVTPDTVRGWVEEATTICVTVAIQGCRRHFADLKGPDGKPWARLAHDRPGGTGDAPLTDRGNLLRSIVGEANGSKLVLWTDRPGSRLQNFGGSIVPVNSHYLAIPATVKAKESGSPTKYPDELFPRVNRSKTKGVLLAEGDDASQKSSGDGFHVAYYLTTGPVVVPKREFIGFSEETVTEILDTTLEHVLDRWLFSESRR